VKGRAREKKSNERRPRIFVSIPSYRDPECQWTLKDLFDKAAHPECIFIGVCWQVHATQDAHCFEHIPKGRTQQIRTIVLDHSEAKGPCYARALAQRLWRGEEFYLQIDSHMRFVEHWDAKLLSMLASCKNRSDKPIITTYPPDYEPPGRIPTSAKPSILCAKKFDSAGRFRIAARSLQQKPNEPLPSFFWAAGFAFSRAEVIREVPYDVGLVDVFFGEEASMAVRLWTSGWDFFCPTSPAIFHLWSRAHRPTFRELKQDPRVEKAAYARIDFVLGRRKTPPEGMSEAVGLGTARTLAAFQNHTGIDFNRRTITATAMRGGTGEGMLEEDQVQALLKLVAGLS